MSPCHCSRPNSCADAFGGYRVGCQSYCYREFSLEDACRELTGMGLCYFEVFSEHSERFNEEADPEAMKALLKNAGVLCPCYGVVDIDGDEAQTEKLVAFAKTMGMEMITADPTPENLPILNRLVAQYDIKIGIHNHGPGERYNVLEDVLRAIEPWDTRIGACVDTGHYIRSGVDPGTAIRTLGDRVHGVHLKDFTVDEVDSVIGTARLNVLDVLRALKEIDFTGPMMLEYEGDSSNPTPTLMQGLSVLRAMFNAM